MNKLFSLIFIGSFIMLAACAKYEEGPSLRLRSKKARVANDWKIAYAYDLEEQVEITENFTDETWEFTKDGQFFERDKDILDKEGSWDFISDKEELAISYPPSKIKRYTILRLKNNEMWLKDHEEELHLFTTD